MVIRKTPQQIKDEILMSLKEEPLSIEQLRKKVESNWSTTNTYLEELKKEGKVKEIISTDKAKVYQRVFGDTYFDIPITDEERKKFRTLFSLILQSYKSKGMIPKKTQFAKCAVHVIRDESSGLSDLPTIWYLYGLIPQMIADPGQDYQEEIKLEQEKRIKEIILDYIGENGNKRSWQLEAEQHKRYGEELYILSDEFFKIVNKCGFNNDEILDVLNRFFIVCPIDSEFPEVFNLTETVLSLIRKMDLVKIKLQDYRKEILLAFDSLWKFIALYKLYKSRIVGKNAIDKKVLLKFYLGNPLESRRNSLEESISELNSIYLNMLVEFDVDKVELSEESKKIRKIMQDWTGED